MVDRSLNLRQYVWVYAPLLIVGAIGAGAALGGQDDPSSLRHTAVDIAMILLEAVLAGYIWTLRGRLDGDLPRWLSLSFALAAVMATVDFSSAGAWDRTLGEDFESSRVWLGWSWTFAGLVLPFALGAALLFARRDGHPVRKKEVIAMVVGVMVLLVIALKLRVALLGSAGALSENVIAAVIWLGLGIISWRQKASYRIAPALAGYAGAQALAHLTAMFASTEDPHALAAHFGKICSEIILLVALIQLATREQTRGVVLRQVQDELHAGARELGVVRDRLRMGEARLAGIVDSAMDPIISVNAEQRIVLFNVAAERVFRCSASDALNQDLSKFIPMRYQEAHRRHVQGFGKTGDTSRSMRSLGELLGRRADGEEFPIEASISQIEIDGQKIFTVILRDITERKRAEIVLREKERQLHATDRRLAEIVQGMTEACFAVDTDWKFTFVNDRSATLLKRTREQMLGHSLWEIFPHLVGAAPEKHYRQVMHERSAQSFEILSPIAGRWLEVRLFPTSEGVAAFLLDISERKAAEESVRLSEWKFAQAFANNPAAIALVRMEDGVVLDVNDTWLSLCGYTRVEILHHSVRDLWPDPAEAARFVEALREKGVVRGREQTFRKKSGELFVTEFSSQVLTFNGEAVILSTLIDVTEKKRVEATFRRQEALLREAGHIAKVGGWEFDVRTGEGSWTEEVARIHGLDPKSGTNINVGLSHYRGESLRRIQAAIQAAIGEGKAYDLELELTAADGAHKWVRTIGYPVIEEGRAVVVRGSFQDITDRKRAEAALKESEQQFRQVVEAINEVFWITDVEKSRILYVSPAYESIWGRTCESLYQDPTAWAQAIHSEDRDRVMAAVAKKQAAGTYNEIFRIVRPDQSERWVHDRAFPVRNEKGEVYRVVGTAADVTDKKRGELRASVHHAVIRVLSEGTPLNESMRRLLEIICRQFNWEFADLWSVDKTSKLLRCVEVWHSLTGDFQAFVDATRSLSFDRGQGLPGRVWERNSPVDFPDIQNDSRFLRKAEASVIGLRSGVGFPIVMRRELFGVFEFFSRRPMPLDDDLLALLTLVGTQIGEFIERKQLEDKFRQAQKMEAIGTLAGGIAHDFNNVLGGITGYTDLAKMEAADRPDILECLNAVSAASARAADLVQQILAFSRVHEQQRKPMLLSAVVDEALKLLRASIPSTIEFRVLVERPGLTILGDPTQIHQVIMNLATNAAHAMRDRVGRLSVSLERVEVDADTAALHPRLQSRMYMRLGVSDTGHGMDSATVARIFDPFFTTKVPGEGTGLGLAVVHGIVQSHEGVITVYSQPGEGTQFHLYFPAHVSDATVETPSQSQLRQGRGERVLFIDDELSLALLGKKILERLGYVVDEYTVASEAISAFAADPKKYALVITDLTMPEITGTSLAQRIVEISPQTPVLLTTGYSANLTHEKIRELGISDMLLKPFDVSRLAATVQQVLEEKKR